MFESLKKKFSRTSNKLTDELTEEAKKENNIEELKENNTSENKSDNISEDFVEKNENNTSEKTDKNTNLKKNKSFSDSSKEKNNESEIESTHNDNNKKNNSRISFFSKLKRNKNKTNSDEVFEDKSEKKSNVDSKNDHNNQLTNLKSNNESFTELMPQEDDKSKLEKKSNLLSKFKNNNTDSEEKKSSILSFIKEKTISEKNVEDILWELEMGLLEADVAIDVANTVVNSVKNELIGQKIKRSDDIAEYTFEAFKHAITKIIDIPGKSMTEMIEDKKSKGEPLVVMFVGINGTGKTTTIGKIANYYIKQGYEPVIAASDTFRAGAIEQITHHADNLDVKIIKHQKGSDPAAVAYDAVEHAKSKGKDLVLIDTAGRMQNNINLMDEMKKINRVAKPDLVVFVGDALTGNDATEQATKFNDAIGIDGVILTKADADSKGGASLSIGYIIKKPILFLGMGQKYDDIKEYDSDWMLNQIFSDIEV